MHLNKNRERERELITSNGCFMKVSVLITSAWVGNNTSVLNPLKSTDAEFRAEGDHSKSNALA